MSSVSVIIPCYRYAQFFPECVASVLAQRDVDLRVLILDDASPDETPAVAAALAATDSRIEYRRHAANQGHIATYNDGLAWASGDYTAMVSADDLLTPGALARAARLLDAHPEVGFVYGSIVPFVSGQPSSPAMPSTYTLGPRPRPNILACNWCGCSGQACCRCCGRGTGACFTRGLITSNDRSGT
jgi:glycosyltransferase involved in cell wall biosynthesis